MEGESGEVHSASHPLVSLRKLAGAVRGGCPCVLLPFAFAQLSRRQPFQYALSFARDTLPLSFAGEPLSGAPSRHARVRRSGRRRLLERKASTGRGAVDQLLLRGTGFATQLALSRAPEGSPESVLFCWVPSPNTPSLPPIASSKHLRASKPRSSGASRLRSPFPVGSPLQPLRFRVSSTPSFVRYQILHEAYRRRSGEVVRAGCTALAPGQEDAQTKAPEVSVPRARTPPLTQRARARATFCARTFA